MNTLSSTSETQWLDNLTLRAQLNGDITHAEALELQAADLVLESLTLPTNMTPSMTLEPQETNPEREGRGPELYLLAEISMTIQERDVTRAVGQGSHPSEGDRNQDQAAPHRHSPRERTGQGGQPSSWKSRTSTDRRTKMRGLNVHSRRPVASGFFFARQVSSNPNQQQLTQEHNDTPPGDATRRASQFYNRLHDIPCLKAAQASITMESGSSRV